MRTFVTAITIAMALGHHANAQDSPPSCGAWPFGINSVVGIDDTRDLLFAGSGSAVIIQDVSDPSAPVVLSDAIRTKGLVSDLFYDDSNLRLYIAADEGGLEVWSIADAAAPIQLGTLDLFHTADKSVPVPALSVVAQGDMAYVATEFAGVQFIDVTNPKDMFRTGASNGAVPNTFIFLQSTYDLAIGNGFVFASGNNFVKFQILADGALQPIQGSTNFSIEVHLDGNFAYLIGTSGNSDIVIMDAVGIPGDPTLPTIAFHEISTGGSLLDAFVQDNIAYIADPSVFSTWDVSDPTNFQPLGTFERSSAELIIDGGVAYGASGDDTLMIDVSDPANIVQLAAVASPGSLVYAAATDGPLAFLADSTQGLRVLDVTDASNPATIGQLDTPDFALDIVTRDNLAFLATAFSGLWIVDISDPTNPFMTGSLDVFGYARRVVLAGDHAYVTDLFDGVRVVDISDPANPQQAAVVFSGIFTNDVFAQGDLLFICNDAGLDIFDISTPASPVALGTFAISGAQSVAVDGDFAYVTDFDSLRVINVADPEAPTLMGVYEPGGFFATELMVQDDLAFVVDAGEGLRIIDVSNPSNPTEVQFINTPGDAFNLSLDGERIYVCDGHTGLRIFGDCEIATPGDLNGDGNVGTPDLLILLGAWGACGDCASCPADLDSDCEVGTGDLLMLLGDWG